MEIFNFLWLSGTTTYPYTTHFLSKSIFGEPTWFCIVHPNLDPTPGVAIECKGFYCSMWELRVGSGPRSLISHRKLKISISHDVVILASEPDAMLSREHLVSIPAPPGALNTAQYILDYKSQLIKQNKFLSSTDFIINFAFICNFYHKLDIIDRLAFQILPYFVSS